MKFVLSIFIVAILIPTASMAQSKVSKAQIQQVVKLSKSGQTDKAIAKIDSLRKVVTVKDSNYVFLLGISEEINARANYYEAGIHDDEEIIKLWPSTEIGGLGYIGQYKAMIGDFDGAIAAYTRLQTLDKSKAEIYDYLASLYNQSGKYKEAIAILDAKPMKERAPQDLYQYSLAYFNLNLPDSAKPRIEVLIKYTGGDFQSDMLGAQIYAALGDKKKACEYISKATALITETKMEEHMKEKPARVQVYYFVKETLHQIALAKELKTKVCE